ncbi:ASST-domain-containing protein [Aspergillus leporis]|uniref:ASST-domain-containing protein n=1 Tax=Aspergillus leporis TaxID=41062 RepID=A0A5N5X1A1_9EURO|nr:ASST-domain-containing protein [Aspergillus leporis]
MLRTLLALTATLAFTPIQADHGPYIQSTAYDDGKFGEWPTETYRSSPIVGPALNYLQYSDECKDGLYTFIAPRGNKVGNPGPMILDQDGHLVWTKKYGQTYNLNVYTFKGQDYLTFWVGNDGVGGHGEGAYYMLDSTYQETYKITAANALPADLHDFHLTDQGTALITIYDIYPANLTSVSGSPQGTIYDGTFQELDLETGALLFQWRASDHFAFTDSYRPPESADIDSTAPWDFFHINSVDKDPKGNYLISSRYTSTLTYIDGRTGDIIWRLGGKHNDFTDLSNGTATNFKWQHHARFRDNGTAITVFDNASRGAGAPQSPSRGLYLDIDQEKMTVAVRHEYWNPESISSQSQGSVQVLDGGGMEEKVLIGYGHIPTWTEYRLSGEVLCNVHLGSASGDGNIMSYRVLKNRWAGNPITSPDISVYQYTAAVSWNGATEVVTWALEGANSKDSKSGTFLTAMPKEGFETLITIPADADSRYIRALGLNSTGHMLGTSKLVRWNPSSDEPVVGRHDEEDEGTGRVVGLFFGGFISALVVAALGWGVKWWWDRRGSVGEDDGERGVWQKLDRFNGDEDLSEGEMEEDAEFALLGPGRGHGLLGDDSDDPDDDDDDGGWKRS